MDDPPFLAHSLQDQRSAAKRLLSLKPERHDRDIFVGADLQVERLDIQSIAASLPRQSEEAMKGGEDGISPLDSPLREGAVWKEHRDVRREKAVEPLLVHLPEGLKEVRRRFLGRLWCSDDCQEEKGEGREHHHRLSAAGPGRVTAHRLNAALSHGEAGSPIPLLRGRVLLRGRCVYRTVMNDTPDDGDLVSASPKVAVPEDVQEAIRTLIRWAGDDPDREGLLDTPRRVARAWREYARGYGEDPARHLSRTFDEVGGYDEIVLLKDIPFQSHCEHHLAPIIGKASIAYLPANRVVGISKLARVLHGFARRLQVQERLTAQVADCICEHLQPLGVAVVIEASHACMTARGVSTPGVMMTTSRMMGVFRDDERSRREVLALMGY